MRLGVSRQSRGSLGRPVRLILLLCSKPPTECNDSGPNWIHGTGNNPIMTIAEATQTVTHDPEGGNIVLARDGTVVDGGLVAKVEEFMWATIEDAFERSNQHGKSIPPEQSLFDFFQERVQQTNFSPAEKELCLDACKLWGAYVGDPVERQSLKFFCLEECIDGSAYLILMKKVISDRGR